MWMLYGVVLGDLSQHKSCVLYLVSVIDTQGYSLSTSGEGPDFTGTPTSPSAASPGCCLGCRIGTTFPMAWMRQFSVPGKAQVRQRMWEVIH